MLLIEAGILLSLHHINININIAEVSDFQSFASNREAPTKPVADGCGGLNVWAPPGKLIEHFCLCLCCCLFLSLPLSVEGKRAYLLWHNQVIVVVVGGEGGAATETATATQSMGRKFCRLLVDWTLECASFFLFSKARHQVVAFVCLAHFLPGYIQIEPASQVTLCSLFSNTHMFRYAAIWTISDHTNYYQLHLAAYHSIGAQEFHR